MADRILYTDEAALTEANVIRANLADPDATPDRIAKVRLFDETIVPTQQTTKAELEAAETTLTGYPAGGYPVVDMADAIFAPGGGAIINTPIINVAYASGAGVQIGGYWVEDLEENVRQVFIYDPPRTLAALGDGFPLVATFGYGRNAS